MLHDETLTVVRRTPGPAGRGGIATYVEERVDLEDVNVQPVETVETQGKTSPVTTRWRCSTLDPEDWIKHQDRVEWQGKTYEVQGGPKTFWAVLPHTEFEIALVVD